MRPPTRPSASRCPPACVFSSRLKALPSRNSLIETCCQLARRLRLQPGAEPQIAVGIARQSRHPLEIVDHQSRGGALVPIKQHLRFGPQDRIGGAQALAQFDRFAPAASETPTRICRIDHSSRPTETTTNESAPAPTDSSSILPALTCPERRQIAPGDRGRQEADADRADEHQPGEIGTKQRARRAARLCMRLRTARRLPRIDRSPESRFAARPDRRAI